MGHQQHLYSHAFYPVLAYVMAALGSGLGLACAARFHARGLAKGWAWLAAGALTLGSGIWGMHFIAMLGFSVDGVELRYDVPLTALSLVVAIVIVGVGMLVAGLKPSWGGLLAGGAGAGVAAAAMHYLGMAALRFPGTFAYTTTLVVLSVVIAVAAATVALWFTLRVTRARATVGASLVMAIAISGMHYTAMTAVTVRSVSGVVSEDGVTGITLVAPLIIGLGIEVLLVLFAVLVNPVEVVGNAGAAPREEFTSRPHENRPAPEAVQHTAPASYHVPAPAAHFEAFGGDQAIRTAIPANTGAEIPGIEGECRGPGRRGRHSRRPRLLPLVLPFSLPVPFPRALPPIASATSASAAKVWPLTNSSQWGSAAAMPPASGR